MSLSRKEFIKLDKQVVYYPPIFKKGISIFLKVQCITCNNIIDISIGAYMKRRVRGPWSCIKCIKPQLIERSKNNPLYKNKKYQDKFKKLHENKEYHDKVHSKNINEIISKSSKLAWEDSAKRKNHMKHRATREFKERVSKWSKEKWETEEYRKKQRNIRNTVDYHVKASERSKQLWKSQDYRNKITSMWNDPKHREKILAILDKYRPMTVINKKNVSKIQRSLYLILDDLGVDYYPEGNETIAQFVCRNDRLRSFIFDCLIIYGNKRLYVECHSNYYHSSPRKIALDISKAAYLNKHMNANLLVIWESEFKDFDMIRKIIMMKLNINICEKKFSFNNVIIKKEVSNDQLKVFFGRYHYLANIGRFNSYSVAGFLDNKIIICALFNNPTRNETAIRLHLKQSEVQELTRFCIHPEYQKKNFASWFLSKATTIIKKEKKVKKFIAFSDLSQGHYGVIYKASGWNEDGIIPPDYWYIDDDGMKHHKKSIWNRSKKEKQTELQYAKDNNLRKIFYLSKIRYVL